MSRYQRWLHLCSAFVIVFVAFGMREPVARGQTVPPADFYVTTTLDLTSDNPTCSSPCSLRQAIETANAAGPGRIIGFDIPNTDPGYDSSDQNARTWTITLADPLPFLAQDNTTIDGGYQARQRGGNPNIFGPEIIIDGSNITTSGGILAYSNNNRILGMGFIRFQGGNPTGTAIEVKGNGNTIQGNYVGLNKYGTGAVDGANRPTGNTGAGIWVRGNNNTVGGNSSDATNEFNVISGNFADGILIEGDANIIRGNYIGTNRTGLSPVPNRENGINVRIGADGNTIGTDANSSDAVFRNLVSGNNGYGIVVRDSANNKIFGNWLGLNDDGDRVMPNAKGGVQILGDGGISTAGNVVGGTSPAARNLIAGNIGPGVYISGKFATGAKIANNYIGLNLSGMVPMTSVVTSTTQVRNQTYGVLIDRGAHDNTIGGTVAADRNIISGNSLDGVRIVGDYTRTQFSNGNIVSANYIGTDITGVFSRSNSGAGVLVGTGANFSRIGGPTNDERNIIAFNERNGVYIRPNNPADVLVAPILTTTLQLNTVTSNSGYGVRVDSAQFTTMRGTDVRYNTASGVSIISALQTTVGGVDSNTRASITGNGVHGVESTDSLTTTLEYVTTTPQFDILVPNGGNGLNVVGDGWLYVRTSNLDDNIGAGAAITNVVHLAIEGTSDNVRGTLSRNGRQGASLTDVVSGTIQFNQIHNNRGDGVAFGGASDDVSVFRNLVRYNGPQNNGTSAIPSEAAFAASCSGDPRTLAGQGVALRDSTKRVDITRTLFGQNCGLGILREPNTSDPTTPNQGIQPPVFTALNQDRVLRGRIALTGPGRCEGCTVEIFRTDPTLKTPDMEGFRKLNSGEDQIKTFDEQGNFSFTLSELPPQVLATATDRFGNTSEFGVFTTIRLVDIEPPRTFLNAIPTQVITYYHTVTNTGTLDDIFRLSFASEKGFTGSEIKLQPAGNFAVAAGKAVPVTVTLTLPVGTDPRVRAGTVERTRITVSSASLATVTDSVTDTTTIAASVVISVTPPSANGETQVGKTLTYNHKITNNGNITATVNLSLGTTPNWATTINTTTITLLPGQSRDIAVGVTPPVGAEQGAKAVTLINVNVPGYPGQNKVVTDTTTVVVSPRAILYPDRTGDGAANLTTTYLHTVENRSNGTVRFRLTASSSLGSTVTFVSATPGITLDGQNSFQLGTATGSNILNFEARVRIPANATRGSVDTVTIQLIDVTTNTVIASVQDKTTITVGIGGSRTVYMPIIKK